MISWPLSLFFFLRFILFVLRSGFDHQAKRDELGASESTHGCVPFVWVLEVGLFRSTKEMWRFGLNSPCVCTNETVILIVDHLSSCMFCRGAFLPVSPWLCFCIQVVKSLYHQHYCVGCCL
ncbi:hypothetical protein VPH35_092352 [Triticum aestivum]